MLNLTPDDPVNGHLVAVLKAQCAALAPLQVESGLWRTLLDVSEGEGSYVEASATAGFAFGILKACRKRYISRAKYDEVAIRAIRGVLNNLSPDGELLNTIGRKYDQYLDFRQQDAHEFLRHMLDATRMEELDVSRRTLLPTTVTSPTDSLPL